MELWIGVYGHIVLGSYLLQSSPASISCVGCWPTPKIGEIINVKIDDYTDPTAAEVDTIYTVIACRYIVGCPLINPNPQYYLWTFFCP